MGKVVSFDRVDPINPPKSILLDTTFIVNLTHQITSFPTAKPEKFKDAEKSSISCKNFIEELVKKYNTRILICDLVLAEFAHIIYRDILERRFGNDWKRQYEGNPAFIRPGHSKIVKAYRHLNVFLDKDLIQTGENIRKKTFKIMRHLDTCPNDAYIASVALENSLHGIAHLNPRDYNKIAKYYPVDAYAPAELAQY